ncbi:uncharacterized protein LOC133705150 isoform X1 [Populus nigra]|uniref:uncharacterized protein LOC133705150 isoform X1 n=1 Tax=Populus nigra TaxID=3691 RepID=UPI002B267478|nr:uncharacterized protein LOC133705150 isoform X1 [Populus nigra]
MEDAGGKASCKMVQRPDLLDYTTSSNHADRTPNNTQLVDAAATESHQRDDQYQKLTKYDGDNATLVIDPVTTTKYGIEVSQDSLATCWECSQKIMKGEVRVFLRVEGQASKRLLLDHPKCFMNLYPSIQVEKLAGWETLSASDQAAVLLLVKKVPPAALTDIKDMGKEDRELPQSASKAGTKHRKDLDCDQNLKVAKAEEDVITSRAAFASAKNTNDWEPKLMAQSKDSWSLAEECKRDCQFGTEKKLQLEPINAKALPETSCKTMPEASGAPDFVEAASTWSATESKEECKDKKEALSDYVIDKIDKDIADMADKGCTIDNGGLDYKLFLLSKAWGYMKERRLLLKQIDAEATPKTTSCKAMAEASGAQCKRDDVDGDLELKVSKARGEVTTISLESVKTSNDLENSKLEAESKEVQGLTEELDTCVNANTRVGF